MTMTTPAAVKRRMAAFLKLDEARLDDQAPLAGLVHESFVLIQMVMDLQEEFGARLVQDDLRDVQTVGQLVAQVVAHAS